MRRKTAVVTITTKEGDSYAEVFSKVRKNVSLQELGIQNTKIRKAFNDGIIIEVPGKDGAELASTLRDRLTEVLGAEVRVDRPVAKGKLRITGIDPSTTHDEIFMELMNVSGPPADLKVSNIRPMRDGMDELPYKHGYNDRGEGIPQSWMDEISR